MDTTAATGDTADPPPAWVLLDMGYITSCGVLDDGRLICWGYDEWVAAAPTEGFFDSVSVGADGGCALTRDGGVSCWCVYADQERACEEQPLDGGYVEVQSGAYWACAERADGTLRCWGAEPSPGQPPAEPVLDWSIEENVGCAVLLDGSISCWGDTELWTRDWDTAADTAAEPISGPPEEFKYTQVAVGRTHACGLDTAGEVHCWGQTAFQIPYPDPPPGPYASITAYNQTTCGLRPDSTAECWYDFPQLWDVDDAPFEADGGPKWEPPPGERWASIGLGEWDACGLTVDGKAHCWMVKMDTAGEVTELPAPSELK